MNDRDFCARDYFLALGIKKVAKNPPALLDPGAKRCEAGSWLKMTNTLLHKCAHLGEKPKTAREFV
ncbi:hypothetical protein [Runella sp.]|uniref:hypothetical protein n=1 Tax=Runella sp. TaxID=1960881 RepID=UPI003D10E685